MGGTKKKSAAQQEKSQTDESPAKSGSKSKRKGDKKSDSGSQKAEISVILNDQDGLKVIKSSKVITKQELARQTGVKISTANAFLRNALEKGLVKRVGGNSGHYIYQPVSA